MLLLIAAGCAYRLFTRDWQDEPDREGLMQFVGLLVALAAIATLSDGPAAISAVRGGRVSQLGEAGTNPGVYLTGSRGDAEGRALRKAQENQHLRTRRKRRDAGWRRASFGRVGAYEEYCTYEYRRQATETG